MISTQVLPELQSLDDSEEKSTSEVVGFIIVGDKKFEVKKGETKIGRDSSMCSIVIENFTVSKVHAIIESEGVDDTFIYDVGSTNQTKLKKKVLKPHCRYKLDRESDLIFGNVTAKFILPSDNSNSDAEPNKSNFVNLNSVEELGDIFDLATQVTAPPSTAYNETLVFEKQKRNFSVFKIPNLQLSARVVKSGESLRNIFDETTQCKLNVEETSRIASHNSSFENFDIFSLKTQCQIYETSITEDNKCETEIIPSNVSHIDNETDKIKSLLNDGQDDVLCSFMTLHSPKGKNDKSLAEVKTKVEVINLSQELDSSSQTQSDIIEEPSANYKTEGKDLVKNKYLSIDSSHKSICKPSITSTPLKKNCGLDHSNHISENNSSFIEHMEEDFVMTQEFIAADLNSSKKPKNASHDFVSLSQDEETQPYLEKTLYDFSPKEQKNINEDLILTQNFEILEKSYPNIEINKIIPETKDPIKVNCTVNQIDNFEKERQEIKEKNSKKESSFLPENSNEEVKFNSSETLDFTQRSDLNDFISTQIFEGTTDFRKEITSLKQHDSCCDEDFISTQPVQLSLIKPGSSRSPQQQIVSVKLSSKESSPDLLGLQDSWENPEDCIATQKFEISECRNLKRSLPKFSLQSDSYISSDFESKKYDCSVESTKIPKIIDSSGDETESDLEVLFDDNEKGAKKKFSESVLKSFKIDSESENIIQREKSPFSENDSNLSYVFELKPDNHLEDNELIIEPSRQPEADKSDSDFTDCEELVAMYQKIPKKAEPSTKTEIEKDLINLTVPHDFGENTFGSNDERTNDKGSPKFEIGKDKLENSSENSLLSPLSLEMPCTQDIETTVNSLLENKDEKKKDFQNPLKIIKNEVGIKNLDCTSINKTDFSDRHINSLLKRPLDSNIADTLPLKKPKNEILNRLFKNSDKQFSKLVKAHDISQIQPSRTRNSVKMISTENHLNKTDISLGSSITNESPTSRRKASGKRSVKKSNGNITSYLTTKKVECLRSSCAERKKEIFLKENKMELKHDEGNIRILRSSKRNNGILIDFPTRIRKSKRNFRSRSGEYLNNSCFNIVFTGFECETLDKIINDLGGKKTNDLSFGEVVVADKVRRTVKFLCAVGLSLPIASPEWLMSCKKKKRFLNPWNFILKDEESEEKWDFELRTSLEKSRKMKLLQGFNVFVTKSTKPPVKDMLAIVESCGGTPLFSPPDVWPKNTIIVTCLEDKKWWPLAKFRNVKIVHYEFILSGVLKQQIDFKTYRLR